MNCVSRPVKSPGIPVSLQKWQVISRSPGNIKKSPGIEVILLQTTGRKKCLPLENFCNYPPPQRTRPAYGDHGKFLLLPPLPPTESGRFPEIPQNLPGVIGRVAPPKQKFWLRRCYISTQCSLNMKLQLFQKYSREFLQSQVIFIYVLIELPIKCSKCGVVVIITWRLSIQYIAVFQVSNVGN